MKYLKQSCAEIKTSRCFKSLLVLVSILKNFLK